MIAHVRHRRVSRVPCQLGQAERGCRSMTTTTRAIDRLRQDCLVPTWAYACVGEWRGVWLNVNDTSKRHGCVHVLFWVGRNVGMYGAP